MPGYLSRLGSNNSGLNDTSGRGFPDIPAYSVDFQTVLNGTATSDVGTSCSTPTWASAVALLNDKLVTASMPLYSHIFTLLTNTVE